MVLRLDRAVDLLEDLRADIDRSGFDVEALLDRLDHDPDGIIDFVRKEIRFEPYAGLLRGAQGTLVSRAGNALDQSFLLANLLKDAGYDARIGEGLISAADARRLVEETLERPPSKIVAESIEISAALVAEIGDLLGTSREEVDTLIGEATTEADRLKGMLETETREISDRLLGELEAAGIELDKPVDPEGVIQETTRYFWVEYRESSTTDWSPVHPIASTEWHPKIREGAEVGYHTDSIPESLQHRFRLEVLLEQKVGSKLSISPVMAPWERPVANLFGEPIVYSNIPDAILTPDQIQGPDQILEDSEFLIPVLGDSIPPGGKVFDTAGNLIPPDLLGVGQTGIFRTVGEKTRKATDAIAALGSSKKKAPSMTLTAQWLKITLVEPGGDSRIIQRTLLDRLGPTARQASDSESVLEMSDREIIAALTRKISIMVAPGAYSEAFAHDLMLTELLAMQPLLRMFLEKARDPSIALSELQRRYSEIDIRAVGLVNLFRAFDRRGTQEETRLIYRDRPNVVAMWESPLDPSGGIAIDIMSNGRRALASQGGRVVELPETLLATGVWETQVESAALGPEQRGLGTAEIMTSAREESLTVRVIRPEQKAELASLELDDATRLDAAEDLGNGYAVIIPERFSDAHSMISGWWRVDTESGETLGRVTGGGGMTFIEYLAVTATGLLLAYVLVDFVMCLGRDNTGGTGQGLAIGAVCGLCAGLIFASAYITIAVVATGGPAGMAWLALINYLLREVGCRATLDWLSSDLPGFAPDALQACMESPVGRGSL